MNTLYNTLVKNLAMIIQDKISSMKIPHWKSLLVGVWVQLCPCKKFSKHWSKLSFFLWKMFDIKIRTAVTVLMLHTISIRQKQDCNSSFQICLSLWTIDVYALDILTWKPKIGCSLQVCLQQSCNESALQ